MHALPTLARWEPDETILDRVEPLMRHEFDLLGSGPTQLGERIDWHVDFKTGRWVGDVSDDVAFSRLLAEFGESETQT